IARPVACGRPSKRSSPRPAFVGATRELSWASGRRVCICREWGGVTTRIVEIISIRFGAPFPTHLGEPPVWPGPGTEVVAQALGHGYHRLSRVIVRLQPAELLQNIAL